MKKKYLMAVFAIVLFIPAAIAQSCSTLAITSTIDGSVCGEGSVTLGATASGTGNDIYWYDAATNGNYLGSGASFQTPTINSTTSFWATEVITSGVTINGGGKTTPVSSNGGVYSSDDYGLVFDATSAFTLVDVEVYPTGAGGSVDISLEDSSGSVLATTTVTVPSGTGVTPHVITLNFNVPIGSDHVIRATSGTQFFRENSGISFPYAIGSVGSITAAAFPTSVQSTYYYFFYNWTVTTGSVTCESTSRAEVIATVNNVADIVATTTLPYTSTESTGNFANNYSGMPGNDCNTSGNYLEGNDVVYEFSPVSDMVVKLGLSGITGSDAAIFVYDDCNEIGDSCLDGAVNIGSSSDFAIDEFTVYQGETYYIVISGDGTSASIDYTLTIEEATVNCVDYTAGPEVGTPEFFNPGQTLDDLDIVGGNLTFYSDAAGTTVLPNTTPAVDGTTYYVSQTLNGCQSDIVPVEVKEINCSQLDVVNTTGDTIPCVGSGTLQAIASGTGTDIYWYENQTGGDPVGYGASFTTPQLTQNTSYWAAEVTATGVTVGGNARLAPDSGSNDFGGSSGLTFTALQQFTLVDVEIYPDGEAGIFDIELVDTATDAVVATTSVTVPNMDGATPFVVTLNFDVQPGTYKILQNGNIDMTRDYASDSAFPYPIGPNASYGEVTTGATSSGTSSNYYYFYNWTVKTGNIICESPREEAIATIDTNGDIQVTTLPYNDSNNDTANYGNPYEGAPGTSCGTTENYLNGNDVVYKFTAPNTELVDILMSDLSGFYASVFVYDSCGDLLNSCLAGAVAGPSDDDFGINDFSVTAGEDYYIVISSWLNPTVGYTLDIVPFTCASLGTPTGLSPQEFVVNETLADLEVDPTENPATLNWYSDAAATISIPDTTLLVDNTTYYVTQTYNGCESDPLAITVSEIDCGSLSIVSSNGDSTNCQGALTLTASASGTGNDIYWYDSATGGNPIEFGTTFNTPILTSTTSYWASEVKLEGAGNSFGIGEQTYNYGFGSTLFTTPKGLEFNAAKAFTIVDVEVFSTSSSSGTMDVILLDDTGSIVASTNVSMPSGSTSSPTAVTIPLNFFVPGSGDYQLVAEKTSGSVAMMYEYDFAGLAYPMSIGGSGEILEGVSGSSTYDYYYYYFYNWTINEGELICESLPRTEVVATVNQTGDVIIDYTDLPYSTNDSTSIYGDNFDGDPGSDCPGTNYLGGNEVVYQYTADAINDDIIQIELTGVTNSNTGMYLYTSCGDVGTSCLDGATNDDSPSTITISDYSIAAGETLFIVISSESGTVNYTLDIYGFDCNNVAGPIVNDTSPYFVQPDTLNDIDLVENVNSSGISWYSDAGATMPIPLNTPLVDGVTYYVTQTILGCESAPIAITPVEFDCTDLTVNVNDAIICTPGGEVSLNATPSSFGNAVIWYDAATGGNIVNTGNTFTPTVNQTTSYWVSDAFTDGDVPVSGFGKVAPSATSDTGGTYGLKFDATQNFTLASVEIYPANEAGTFDLVLIDDSTNTELETVSVTVPSLNGTTPFVVNLNFNISPGNYRLVQQGTIDLVRDFSGNNFPYPIGVNSSLGQITSGSSGSSGSTSSNYYYFYNWTVGSADIICESTREEVVVTVNNQPTAAPIGDAVQEFCEGATVADLVSNGVDIKWYSSNTSSASLPLNQTLIDGASYYASQTVDACESDTRLEVTVQVKDNAVLPVGAVNQSYVQGETVADLVVQGDNLTWYTSADGFIFTEIDPTQVVLQDQGVYYVTQTPNGLCESAKLKITVHRDLGLDSPLFEGLTYYPNPMRDKFIIENERMIEQVELYNMLGQKVMSKVSNQRKLSLYVGSLAAGPYFVKVTIDGKSAMIKVIKE